MGDVTVTVEGTSEIMDRLAEIPTVAHDRLNVALQQIGADLTNYIQSEKLSGGVLQARSGALRNSISFMLVDSGNSQSVEIGPRGVSYAAIQERGGTVSLPTLLPKGARALHWITPGGQNVFAARAAAHMVTIPARSYMHSSFEEKQLEITERVQSAVQGLM